MRSDRWASLLGAALVLGAGGVVAGACAGYPPNDCADRGDCPAGDGSTEASGEAGPSGDGAPDQVTGGEGGKESGSDAAPEGGCVAPTSLDCNGTCVDPTLPAHCGTCTNVCGGPDSGGQATCTNGHCGIGCQSPTTLNCGGSCVDPTQPAHCGSCSLSCPVPTTGNGNPVCTLGTDGGGECSVNCTDANSQACPSASGFACYALNDPAHCNGCGNNCPGPVSGNGGPTCNGAPLTCGITCTLGTYHSCANDCHPNTDTPSVTADPCIINEMFGVFVSPSGTDGTSCGTQLSPCKTIGQAMDLAKTANKRVYACGNAGNYTEVGGGGLVVGASRDGVSVFGGLDCTTTPSQWTYNAADKATVSPASGYALQITGLTTGVSFTDFGFDSADASTTPSATPASSIAVFVSGSVLMLTRSAVTAGAGQPGAMGGTASNYSGSASMGTDGTLTGGGPSVTNSCSDGTESTGGAGASIPSPPAQDGSAQPAVGTSNGGLSGATSCAPGTVGATGSSAGTAGAGATSSGSTGASGWTVGASGGPGSKGNPGQGGGGGGSNAAIGAGGGGGAGGCGGAQGLGGASGGSSIAVLSFQSTLVMTSCALVSQAGGAGGSGGVGQSGQSGGAGGPGGGGAPHGCSGGPGGTGGDGSGGGGGAGGLSSGIVWTGTTGPSVNGTTYSTQASVTGITIGAQGAGGGNGATPTANAIFKSN